MPSAATRRRSLLLAGEARLGSPVGAQRLSGLSQIQWARMSGVSLSSVRRWQSWDEYPYHAFETAALVAGVLGDEWAPLVGAYYRAGVESWSSILAVGRLND